MPSRENTDPVLSAIDRGYAALLVTGNIHDFVVRGEEVAYWPQLIADEIHRRGYVVLRYSKSQGARVHGYAGSAPKEKESVDRALNAAGLRSLVNREGQHGPNEVRDFFRNASRLLQMSSDEKKAFALIVDYTEHLAPSVQSSAAAADEQTFVSETLHMLANAPALRKSGNRLICLAREGFQNTLLNDLFCVEVPFPSEAQIGGFLKLALGRRDSAGEPQYGLLADDLSDTDVARVTRGLRLREVEAILWEARAQGAPLSRGQVLDAKADAIRRASEGALAVMTTGLSLGEIIGLDVAKSVFMRMAEKLKAGDRSSPRAVLMAGPPGTAKSTFAPILASLCGFNIVELQNVKNMYVGESERRLRLSLSVVENLQPAILAIDEITETTPSRNAFNGDGGVSLDLLAQLFRFAARDELRGKVLLLAATNVPERLDPAWLDRFDIVPFLELGPHEISQLFPAFEKRARGASSLDPQAAELVEAADVLHRKGASPRKVLDVVNRALFLADGALSPEIVLAAARDYMGAANPIAVAYSSLVALSLTSFQSYLPWSFDPENYIYPWYLEGVVEKKTGVLNAEELRRKIDEYRKQAGF